MMGKAAGAEAGKWGGTYIGSHTPIGPFWGAVGGAVVGGRIASIAIDKIEAEIFRQMGIE